MPQVMTVVMLIFLGVFVGVMLREPRSLWSGFSFFLLLLAFGAFLLTVAAVYGVNRILGTNFMFLSRAGEGNPLAWFESFLGSPGYLLGIPIMAGGCWGLLYGVAGRWKRRGGACKFWKNRI